MPRYWVMAPVQSTPPERFDAVWQYDRDHGVISIGWEQLGDVTAITREDLAQALAAAYPDKPAATISLYKNMLWAFYHEMQPGDFVIARRGTRGLAGVGRIVGPATFGARRHPHVGHSGFIDVEWQEQPRDKSFPTAVFPMQTLTEYSEEQFLNVTGDIREPDVGPEPDVENQTEFILEKYLEDFIVSNFNAIFQGKMAVLEDEEGNGGQQYKTDIGRIDILAVEAQSNAFVVIELKKGRPSDKVVGQILRYMGWVKKNLCAGGQAVKGLIICRDPDPKLDYALEMTNGIDVRYYNVSFGLSENP